MTVRLALLDRNRHGTVHYPKTVDIALVKNGRSDSIGSCRVFQDETGQHFGQLEFDSEVSVDLFFYYRNGINNGDMLIFAGIDLMDSEIKDVPTVRLKDAIVSNSETSD